MIDLETLGTGADAVFLSVAAIQFDPYTGKIGEEFLRTVDLQSALKANRKIDASTLKWWTEQRPEIMRRMFEGKPLPLNEVLYDLYTFFRDFDIVYPWGNGSDFDLSILSHAYRSLQMDQPWKFYNSRCFRTAKGMYKGTITVPKPADAHDPLVDCEYQIKVLHQVINGTRYV